MIAQHALGVQPAVLVLLKPITADSFFGLAAAGGAACIRRSISTRHLSADGLTHGCSSSSAIPIRWAGSATSSLGLGLGLGLGLRLGLGLGLGSRLG